MGDRSFSTIDLNHFRRGIWTRTRDRLSWRLETVWKSLKYRILSDLHRRQSHLRWEDGLLSSQGVIVIPDWTSPCRLMITTFLIWTTTKCQNQWFCKYHSQLLYCSEIVLRKWKMELAQKWTLYTFCILFPDQRSHSKYCLICVVLNNINQHLNL